MVGKFYKLVFIFFTVHAMMSGILHGQEKSEIDSEKNNSSYDKLEPKEFRKLIRTKKFNKPTNGCCSGYVQCNLIVLNKEYADNFRQFCEKNTKSCPLLEVCEEGSPYPRKLAAMADLRTDLPKYTIYHYGKKQEDVEDVKGHWPKDSVAFLIGCSFSYDSALKEAGIKLRSAASGTNVPMYISNIPCNPVGKLQGNMVVSMKPIKIKDVPLEEEITSRFKFAHGAPIHVGDPSQIGIEDLGQPEWGDPVEVFSDEVPVFHACGVTPQLILMLAKIPFVISHAPGHMFVTDTLCTALI